jgi:diadenosine tetraphosphatase ApaH/serine/threonine PP2A family protein phosphatase
MRVAVISDVHGNLSALAAVTTAIEGDHVDATWCLGDVVGYGPRPNRCCAVVRDSAALCLVGNHDLGVVGVLDLDEFSPDAAESARWTRRVLEPGPREFLEALQPEARADGVELYHGSPLDPIWEYVRTYEGAYAALRATLEPVVLVGHTHVALELRLAEGGVSGGVAPAGTEVDLAAGRHLLNPGSVGQPRDGDPRAAYLVLDLDARRASFRRVEYDVARTQAEIRERGLPDALAERLAHGI